MALYALIDTNILIDYVAKRGAYYLDARKIVDGGDRHIFYGCIAAHSIPDIFYILRKSVPADERRETLLRLCEIFDVVGIEKDKLTTALKNTQFTDFEDCLQSLCALDFHADYIVTRNPDDFAQSIVPTITPDVFCQRFLDNSSSEQEAD